MTVIEPARELARQSGRKDLLNSVARPLIPKTISAIQRSLPSHAVWRVAEDGSFVDQVGSPGASLYVVDVRRWLGAVHATRNPSSSLPDMSTTYRPNTLGLRHRTNISIWTDRPLPHTEHMTTENSQRRYQTCHSYA